ncbi:MAG: DUF2007 domain-containing protein [Muribaculaceae bacterium]
MDTNDKLVLLETFEDIMQASIAYQILEENEIACMLTNENVAAVYPIPNVGEIRMMVFEKDYDRARAMLDEAGNQPK